MAFFVNVHVGPLSNQDEVCDLFRGILNESKARTEIRGLEQSSFSYDLPEDGLARISSHYRHPMMGRSRCRRRPRHDTRE
jgi:hypothetical protein